MMLYFKKYYILYFLLTAKFVYGQDSSTVLNSYYDAIGGKAQIDSIQTVIAKVKQSGLLTNATAIWSLKRDYKFHIETLYKDGRNSVYCFNGSKYSGSNKMAVEMLGASPSKMQHISIINELLFIPTSDLLQELPEIINDIKCNVLSYHDAEWGRDYKYFFDINTALLVAEESNLLSQSYKERKIYENYQPINGILFPMRTVEVYDVGETITEYTEIILNPELPDDIFDCNPE